MRKHLGVDVPADREQEQIEETFDQGAIGGALGIAFAIEALAGTRFCVKTIQYLTRTGPNAFRTDDGQTFGTIYAVDSPTYPSGGLSGGTIAAANRCARGGLHRRTGSGGLRRA